MKELTKLIQGDMRPALGVTEPGAIAFAVAKAKGTASAAKKAMNANVAAKVTAITATRKTATDRAVAAAPTTTSTTGCEAMWNVKCGMESNVWCHPERSHEVT